MRKQDFFNTIKEVGEGGVTLDITSDQIHTTNKEVEKTGLVATNLDYAHKIVIDGGTISYQKLIIGNNQQDQTVTVKRMKAQSFILRLKDGLIRVEDGKICHHWS